MCLLENRVSPYFSLVYEVGSNIVKYCMEVRVEDYIKSKGLYCNDEE